MKDAIHHPKKVQKKILREFKKDTLRGGGVAMTADFQNYNPRK